MTETPTPSRRRKPKHKPVSIAGQNILPASRTQIELPVAKLYTHTELSITIKAVRGKQDGPTLFVSAAIHGDEINGVEIVRRLLEHRSLRSLRGTLVAIPVVNVHGFLNTERYLPDGRDLNRSFPGSPKGSLAGRIAHSFLNDVVRHCDYGIDLHTGARHRSNLPQIRADLKDPTTLAMAESFGAPVLLHSRTRDGSLREVATDENIPVLLYEAGEALRFDEVAIRAGVSGIINVMRHIGMLPASRRKKPNRKPMLTNQSFWVRAGVSGVLRALIPLGSLVNKDDVIGIISDPMDDKNTDTPVIASDSGIVIGRSFLPLVYEGDALFHIAKYRGDTDDAQSNIDEFRQEFEPDPDKSHSYDPPIAG
ncbi:succinylglutamate desuccinylase/aspartoacylase family protein [Spongiibacter sp. KMU-158]|uniref:Succinylglutamate desuccinylase/aspartoacylase family protein n=1 Tax=Spongiibacter pelagi TaxID=2760804 RepID=A0A927BXP5_9GAMM|nr:succinylglutamate desuccinylase/aspartoacylase family protein [Spongiibacter pelagi]MBD2857473.1 succinylglutamate desuccinylase/aspartoacylase family protein [Spongiibacter pelagi]